MLDRYLWMKSRNRWLVICWILSPRKSAVFMTSLTQQPGEGHPQSDEHWNYFKGKVGETYEMGWSAYGLSRAHRYYLELNWTELTATVLGTKWQHSATFEHDFQTNRIRNRVKKCSAPIFLSPFFVYNSIPIYGARDTVLVQFPFNCEHSSLGNKPKPDKQNMNAGQCTAPINTVWPTPYLKV